jgi:predicted lipid-binding transport protein (Tim44 family)
LAAAAFDITGVVAAGAAIGVLEGVLGGVPVGALIGALIGALMGALIGVVVWAKAAIGMKDAGRARAAMVAATRANAVGFIGSLR